jgi:glycosyltransferase involved in cell wall biosynthesis
MRFVFISAMASQPWGGSEELWSQAALRLHSEGHQVAASVVWWPQLSTKVVALADQGIEICSGKSPAQSSLSIRAWRKIQKQLGKTPKEFAWLRRQKPDLVVISQGGNGDGSGWMPFCRRTNLPFVSIVQANNEQWWPADRSAIDLAAAYRAARKACFVSRHNLDLLERQIGEHLPNATVVWNPFNVPTEHPLTWPSENGRWKMACVARLEPAAKGQDILFQVLARPEWRNRAVEVNLYGAGPCEQGLKRLADLLELKCVRFKGHVSDVTDIWRENHLLVLPSRYEGLPLSLVEAMWCARPSVVTDNGGNAELCDDGVTGFVAPALTVKLLAEALERAWNCREDWPKIGNMARARAEQLIPKDPVGQFCRQLMEWASKS